MLSGHQDVTASILEGILHFTGTVGCAEKYAMDITGILYGGIDGFLVTTFADAGHSGLQGLGVLTSKCPNTGILHRVLGTPLEDGYGDILTYLGSLRSING